MPASNSPSDRRTSVATAGLCAFFVGTSFLFFAISLANKAFYTDRGADDDGGQSAALLLIGWLGLFEGMVAWYANPFLFGTWLMIWFRPLRAVATGFAIVALGLSLSFMLHDDILTDEGGGRSHITGYGAGYWLWIASIGTMVLGCLTVSIFAAIARRNVALQNDGSARQ